MAVITFGLPRPPHPEQRVITRVISDMKSRIAELEH